MIYNIRYIPSANRDLDAIYNFLEEYPQKADQDIFEN